MSWWWLPKKKNNFPPKTLTYLKDSLVTLEDNTDLYSKFSVVAQVSLWQQNHASCSLAIYGQLLWLPLSVLAAVLSSLPSSCDRRHWEMLWGRINRDDRGYRSKGDEGPGILLTHKIVFLPHVGEVTTNDTGVTMLTTCLRKFWALL